MIAEIRGKVNSANSNLTERSEDELTGNFFGNLRYLPFEKGLKHILKNCKYTSELINYDSIDAGNWPAGITFWPREEEAEPDVLLSFENAVIIVEVKLHSGISSDDDVDNSTLGDELEREISCNQLVRESRLLERIADGRDKILILLAPQTSAHHIYSDVVRRKLLNNDVHFGYITWQMAFDALKGIEQSKLNPYERIIIDDLIALLYKKGFEGFRNFKLSNKNATADKTETWRFHYSVSDGFSFIIEQDVESGAFYEFG